MELIGHVTSSYASSVLGFPIALALIAGGRARMGQTLYVPMPGGDHRGRSHLAGLLRSNGRADQWVNSRCAVPPPSPATDWLKALPPATRLVLHGDAQARAVGRSVWGVGFSEAACRATVAGTRATLWLGPDEYLLLDFAARRASARIEPQTTVASALERALAEVPHALVDISHRQFALEISGPHAGPILNGACPLDLDLQRVSDRHVHAHRVRQGRHGAVAHAGGCVPRRGVALVRRLCHRPARRDRAGILRGGPTNLP